MSLRTSYQTKIIIPRLRPNPVTGELNIKGKGGGHPSLRLLRLALEKVARDHGGTVTTTYSDCEGTEHRCLLAVRTSDFQRGVGLEFEADGRVTFVYDAATLIGGTSREYAGQARYLLDKAEVASAICREIAQNYAVFAVIEVYRQMGFQVRVEEEQTPEGRKVRVTGTKAVGIRGARARGGERGREGRRLNRVLVDEQGEVYLDLIGYVGEECRLVERRFRQGLAALGLQLNPKELHYKRPEEIAAELRQAVVPTHGLREGARTGLEDENENEDEGGLKL